MTQNVPIDLARAGVQEVLAGLERGEFTSVLITRAYLERIAAISDGGPRLNSVRAVNPDALSEAAARDAERAAFRDRAGTADTAKATTASATPLGPLHGVPILIKDNIDVAGMPTTAGSLALEHVVPSGDAPVVAALRAAGAVILGKTNLTEFANYMARGMPSGYSSLGGQVLNPYDVTLTTSGSSAGSGSAAAAGLAAATVGTETSGSILAPSRANSLVGVKPTVGLVSRTGIVPVSSTQDTAGPMVRHVYDAAALLTAMVGIDGADAATGFNPLVGTDFVAALSRTALAGARIGFVLEGVGGGAAGAGFGAAGEEEVYARALALLQERGATLVPVSVSKTDADEILDYEFRRDLNAYLARLPEGQHPDVPRTLAEVIAFNDAHPDATLKFGQARLLECQAIDLDDAVVFARYEALRERGVEESRRAIDSVLSDQGLDAIVSNSALVRVGARAGYPSVVVPSGYLAHGRQPAGLLFTGTAWSEARLLAFAYDFEQAGAFWRAPEELNPSLFRG